LRGGASFLPAHARRIGRLPGFSPLAHPPRQAGDGVLVAVRRAKVRDRVRRFTLHAQWSRGCKSFVTHAAYIGL
jgi:hypothetical protein